MTTNKRDLAVYVLVRTDIPSMNPGKAMAQVHHAGVQMMQNFKDANLVKEYIKMGNESGANGFNTTIVLSATLKIINYCLTRSLSVKPCVSNAVVDPSYPFVVDREAYEYMLTLNNCVGNIATHLNDDKVLITREETTCAWFLGDRNNTEFRALFEGLKLHD